MAGFDMLLLLLPVLQERTRHRLGKVDPSDTGIRLDIRQYQASRTIFFQLRKPQIDIDPSPFLQELEICFVAALQFMYIEDAGAVVCYRFFRHIDILPLQPCI